MTAMGGRAWLLGVAGGVLLASAAGSVPLVMVLAAAAVVAWDAATLAAKTYDLVRERRNDR